MACQIILESNSELGIPTAVKYSGIFHHRSYHSHWRIRSGHRRAKSLTLGASMCSVALPVVAPALKGQKDVVEKLTLIMKNSEQQCFYVGQEL